MKLLKQLAKTVVTLVWILVAGGGLLAILAEVPFVSIPVQMLFLTGAHLLAGWYLFASEMSTRVEFDADFWLKSMVVLLLVSAFLDVMLRAFWKRTSKGNARWRLKWSFGIAGMLMVLSGIGMSIHGTVVAMKWLGADDVSSYRYHRLYASQLYQMGAEYAERFQGELPDKLPDLLGSSEATMALRHRLALFPDASVWEVPEYWTWLGGVPLDGADDVPIAFAPRLNERGKRLVLFRNGMTENCTEEEWQAALERWRQAVKASEEQKVTEATR